MSETKFIDLLKKDMIEAVNVLNFENIDIQRQLLEKQFAVFHSLKELHVFKSEHSLVTKETSLEENRKEEIHPVVEECEIKKPIIEANPIQLRISVEKEKVSMIGTKPIYRFERKIKGGFVPEIEGFVPEGIVRKLGLQHGDMVHATQMETEDTNSRHFRYEMAQKGDGKDAPDRIQLNYCPVKKEAGCLVVEKSSETDQYIRYEDSLYTIVLDELDIRELQVKEGSLIDIAYPVGKPNLAKVIWTHKLDEIPYSNSSQQAPVKKGEKLEKKNKPSIAQTLEGKTVLVIGNQPKKNLYRFAVEQRGGVFLWADAKEKLTRLEPLVRKSDLVVFLLSVSGHVGMEHIKQMCKDYRVPFETTWSKGQTTLIRLAEEKITTTA